MKTYTTGCKIFRVVSHNNRTSQSNNQAGQRSETKRKNSTKLIQTGSTKSTQTHTPKNNPGLKHPACRHIWRRKRRACDSRHSRNLQIWKSSNVGLLKPLNFLEKQKQKTCFQERNQAMAWVIVTTCCWIIRCFNTWALGVDASHVWPSLSCNTLENREKVVFCVGASLATKWLTNS